MKYVLTSITQGKEITKKESYTGILHGQDR